MRLIKILTTSLFLFPSILLLASTPLHTAIILPGDTNRVPNEVTGKNGLTAGEVPALPSAPAPTKAEVELLGGYNATTNPGIANSGKSLFSNTGLGPAIGVGLTIPKGYYFSFRAEVLYSRITYMNVKVVNVPYVLYTNRLGYIDIPLEIQLKPFKNQWALRTLCLFGGFDYSMLVHNASYIQNPLVNNETTPQLAENNNTHKNVIGYTYGIEYSINRVTIGGRITKGTHPFTTDVAHLNSIVGQLSVGYTFKSEAHYHFESVEQGNSQQ